MEPKIASSHFENAWISVDSTEDPGFFVGFLDASRVKALEFARTSPDLAFSHLKLDTDVSVLDCGCGTGDMATIMAGLVAPGLVVGGDFSDFMIDEARRRNKKGPDNLEFQQMDVHALSYADGAFDRVTSTQLLIHVADPLLAVSELCRVTAPGGRISLSDIDWDSLVIGTTDKALGRRFCNLFSDGVRNPLVVREYGAWLRKEGFTNVTLRPQPMVFDNWEFLERWILAPSIKTFGASGAMSAGDIEALMLDLKEREATGRTFGAATMYTTTGDKPTK